MSIRFSCPSCHTDFEVPNAQGGQWTECGSCGQTLVVPAAETALTVVDERTPIVIVEAEPVPANVNLTCGFCGYHSEEVPSSRAGQAQCPRCETPFSSSPMPGRAEPTSASLLEFQPQHRRRTSEYDYEEDDDDRPRRRRRRRREYLEDDDEDRFRFRFRCPYCRTKAPPYTGTRISTAGWITFAILLAFCWPLFWIGLLITEPYSTCSRCGARFG